MGSTNEGGTGPLAGIRVIDLTAMISGPLATMILADQGADVIKVEPPGAGDIMRLFGAMRGGVASTYVNCNRSKRSVVLNLQTEDGRDALRTLVRGADVFLQNFRPGIIGRMGFDYETVHALAPDVIYVSISGFGEQGPLADRPVYDNVVQSLSGMAAVQADPDTGTPELVRNLSLDKATAYTVAQAVTAALFARERGRGGQHVRVAMLDAALAFLWPDGMMNHTFLGDDVMRVPPFGTIYRLYETADGAITIGALTDDQWANACRAMDREDLIMDERFVSLFDRMRHLDALRDELYTIVPRRTTAQWCAQFEMHDVPHAPVLSLDNVPTHPQVVANRVLVETEHPAAGRMREPLPAARFAATPAHPQRPAPGHGEHTAEVLAEAGLAPDAISSVCAAAGLA